MKEIWSVGGTIVAIVDDEDFERAAQFNWHVVNTKNGGCVLRRVSKNKKKTIFSLYRLILDCNNDYFVNYNDGNFLNLQKKNLTLLNIVEYESKRKISVELGKRNSRPRNGKAFKGTCFSLRKNSFFSSITIGKKQKRLGYFPTEELAAHAYDAAAFAAWGTDCYLNFPENYGMPPRPVA